MTKNLINLYKKYEEVINYLIFGVLTTLISIITYVIFRQVFNIEYLISNFLAWILAVLFAYLTNKRFVFTSGVKDRKDTLKELFQFYFYRVVSLLIEMLGLYILVSLIKVDDTLSKVLMQFVVIVLNYVFSKVFVFNSKK